MLHERCSHSIGSTLSHLGGNDGDITPVLVIFLYISLFLSLAFSFIMKLSPVCDRKVHFVRAYIKRFNSMNKETMNN